MNTAVQLAEVEALRAEIAEEMHLGYRADVENQRLLGHIDPPSIEQLTDLWFALRVGRITGSRIGKILGLSNWGDEDSVMREMVREYHGAESEFLGNEATRWGTDNEETARNKAVEELGDPIASCGIYIHPDFPWLAESPDGIRFSTGNPVQIKCPYSKRFDNDPKFESAADRPEYWAQMQLSCEVMDAEACTFIQWTPVAITFEEVKRDREWFASVRPKLELFHQRYLEIIQSEELSAPHLKDHTVERDDEEWLDAARYFKSAKEAEVLAKEAVEEARSRLVALVENRTTRGGGVLVKRFKKQGTVSWATVLKKHGDKFTDIDLDKFRGKASEQITVTVEKEKS